jgi:ethanolamine utilization protein EutA
MSSYGLTLLADLKIIKSIGASFSADEVTKIMAFYVNTLEAIVLSDTGFLGQKIAQQHIQIGINFAKKTKPKLTFSGGVGELIYKIAANEAQPSTTFFGDFGIDLAQAISRSPILSVNLKTHISEHKGRATVMGLTLHSTELSGSSIYLPSPNVLPLRNLPIIAKLPANASATQWHSAFVLANNCKQGACKFAHLQVKSSMACKPTSMSLPGH